MATPTTNRRYSKPTSAERILSSLATFLDQIDRDVHAVASARGSFSAFASARASITSAGATIVFDREEWDQSGWYDVASGRFTPQVAGIYRVSALIELTMDGATSLGLRFMRTNILHKKVQTPVDTTNGLVRVGGSALVKLNGSSDWVAVHAQTSGNTLTTGSGSDAIYFQGEFVGEA